MGKNNYFQFKQFRIIHEQSAMKVGTDGVLLGAWANIGAAKSILDVGTGTGLISIMMAQRSNAKITGIEIEKKAAEEAKINALSCPWSNRIRILHSSFQEFVYKTSEAYDLIISNPPFFENSQKSKCDLLAIAKHNHLLPPAELIGGSARLLTPNGKIAIILPADSVKTIKNLAEKENLQILRETEVRPNNLKKPHRYLLELGKADKVIIKKSTLLIHNEDSNSFTDNYKILTREFYLNF